MTAGVIGIGNKEQHGVCSFCVMWCRRACVVASFAEVSNGGSQDHNWECD